MTATGFLIYCAILAKTSTSYNHWGCYVSFSAKQVLFLLQRILLKGALIKGVLRNRNESRLNRCYKSVSLLWIFILQFSCIFVNIAKSSNCCFSFLCTLVITFSFIQLFLPKSSVIQVKYNEHYLFFPTSQKLLWIIIKTSHRHFIFCHILHS